MNKNQLKKTKANYIIILIAFLFCYYNKEMKKYDVSIIIPVKNNERSLPRCFDSIINQITSYKYEIIIVSDPSIDNTYQIIDDYEKKYSFIKHIKLNSTPIGVARQIGINASNGDYLMFIDADDYYDLNAIQTMVQTIKEQNADIVNASYYYVRGKKIEKNFFSKKAILNKKQMLKELMKDSFMHGFMWNKIYKAELLKNKNYVLPNKNIIREDVLTNFQIFLNCKKLVMIKNPIYYYDKTYESTTSVKDLTRVPWFITIFAIEKYLLEKYEPSYLKMYRSLHFRRKLLIFGDQIIVKKGYTKEQYKLLKKESSKQLKILKKVEPLEIENQIWSEFIKNNFEN